MKNYGLKDKICHIVGAGENYGLDFMPAENDMVIAVDAGFQYLEEKGIAADLVIGDFDSLGYVPEHKNVITLCAEKDDTDMLAAIRRGIDAGYEVFHIYCGTGGRIDHTLANMQSLAYLSENKKRGFLFDKGNIVTAVTDGKIGFKEISSGYLSVFSYSEKAEGVYLRGLKWELTDATLENTFPIGTSNEFTGKESSISVRKGTLLVVFPENVRRKIL